jgi:tetratricopeptide (TPR) repeat protein
VGFQVDKRGIQEHRASLYLQLNRVKEAEEAYRQLLDVNPDNYSYYEGLQKCLGLSPHGKYYSPEQVEKLVQIYDDLCQKYPRSAASKVQSGDPSILLVAAAVLCYLQCYELEWLLVHP